MKNRWFISDLHFGHEGILKHRRVFQNLDQMHDAIITHHNKRVNPEDRVYILGDVVWKKQFLPLIGKLNGRKVLIKGNHDNIASAREYLDYFEDIRGAMSLSVANDIRIIATHIPVHPNEFNRFKLNVHGHDHAHNLKNDKRYFNVCFENVGFQAVHLDQIIFRIERYLC